MERTDCKYVSRISFLKPEKKSFGIPPNFNDTSPFFRRGSVKLCFGDFNEKMEKRILKFEPRFIFVGIQQRVRFLGESWPKSENLPIILINVNKILPNGKIMPALAQSLL